MLSEVPIEPVPLMPDRHGIIRVGGTRVSLDSLIGAYRDGATVEEMAERYPSLALADIYACLGYYLRHRTEIEAYLANGQIESTAVREESKSRHGDWPDLRHRLAARAER